MVVNDVDIWVEEVTGVRKAFCCEGLATNGREWLDDRIAIYEMYKC